MPDAVFQELFLEKLVALSRDRVANVRLLVAEVLALKLLPREHFQTDALKALGESLKADRDRDVRFFANANAPTSGASS